MISMSHHQIDFPFPAEKEPEWKDLVQRWYQLDAPAYGLIEGYWQWRGFEKPDFVLLASPGASNTTDLSFAQTGAISPQKFVHTLPNVRCSPLFEVMQWSGPMLCINRDPCTVLHAIAEGVDLATQGRTVWIFSNIEGKTNKAYLFRLGEKIDGSVRVVPDRQDVDSSDADFIEWLESGRQPFFLLGRFKVVR